MTVAITSSLAGAIASPVRASAGANKRTKAAPSDDSVAVSEQLAAIKTMARDFRATRQDMRAIAKAHAKEQVQQLREQLRVLSKLLAGNPKELARQVARIAKELRAALKEFGDAHKGDVQDAALPREPAAAESVAPSDGAATGPTLEERRRAAGIEETPEAQEMKAFVGEVRGFLKKLRELLQEAKIRAGSVEKDDKERRNPFEIAADELGDLEQDLNRAFHDASAETKVFDAPVSAPGALVSVRV